MKTGKFLGGDPITKLLPDGRKVELQTFVSFLDPKGIIWQAKPGAIVDGASIPRFFWRFIGGPFTGKYRRASIVHDAYCDSKDRPWQDVHRMFYSAMLADGVHPVKAWVMFKAVWYGGPRW